MIKISKYANQTKKFDKEFNKVNEYILKNLKNKYLWHKSYFNGMNIPMRVCDKSLGFFKVTPKQLISPKFKGHPEKKIKVFIPKYTLQEFKKLLNHHNLELIGKFEGLGKKVRVKCIIHDKFFTLKNPLILLNKEATICPACRGHYNALTNEEFITKAKLLHGNKYDYSITKYTSARNKIDIICPAHGVFTQRACDHYINGTGCPKCNSGGFNSHLEGVLYFIEICNGQAYKIGITNYDVQTRYNKKELKNIKVLKTWNFSSGKKARTLERLIINTFKEFKYEGPVLLETAKTAEMFNINILDKIEKLITLNTP